MNGGEPETVGQVDPRGGRARSTPIISDRPGRRLILAGDFRDRPGGAGRALPRVAGRTRQQRAVAAQAPAPRPRRLLLIDRPGAVQADIRLRRVRHRPARPALVRHHRRQLRDGRRVPVPAERGAARGQGLHLRRTDELLAAAAAAARSRSRARSAPRWWSTRCSITRDLIDVEPTPVHRRGGERGGRLLHRRLARCGTPPPTGSPTRPPPRR